MRLKLILSFTLVVLVSIAGVVFTARQGAATEVRLFMQRGGMIRLENIAAQLEAYYRQSGSWEGVGGLVVELASASGGGAGVGNRPDHAGQGMMSAMRTELLLADASGKIIADTSGSARPGDLSAGERQLALPLKSGFRTVGIPSAARRHELF
jgi:hypothetical protein